MSSVSAYYYLRVVWYMYFREATEGARLRRPTPRPADGRHRGGARCRPGAVPGAADPRRQGALRVILGG